MMQESTLLYQIGLTLIPNIGDVNGKKLLAYCGGLEAVFKATKSSLLKIPGIGQHTVNSILNQKVLLRAEQEMEFISKNNIQTFFYTEGGYPKRLLHCEDGPMLLYGKGNLSFNVNRVLAVVGTRRASRYGKQICQEIIDELEDEDLLILSGLAYGIDACAHRQAVKNKMQTIGVLGHGLDKLYPAVHRKLSEEMLDNGGLISEFLSETIPDRENFPKRNRIVAGMCDAVLVIESDRRGGALITAEIANSYNRDVFAIPGNVGHQLVRGCHYLIKQNKAALVESAKDIYMHMGWEKQELVPKKQTVLFHSLTEDENRVLKIMRVSKEMSIDQIALQSQLPMSKVAAALLNLEFEGLVSSFPGKRYVLR